MAVPISNKPRVIRLVLFATLVAFLLVTLLHRANARPATAKSGAQPNTLPSQKEQLVVPPSFSEGSSAVSNEPFEQTINVDHNVADPGYRAQKLHDGEQLIVPPSFSEGFSFGTHDAELQKQSIDVVHNVADPGYQEHKEELALRKHYENDEPEDLGALRVNGSQVLR